MENKKPVNALLAGVIISAVLIVFSILLNLLGQDQNRGLQMLTYLILIAGLIFFITQYGKANDYQKTFGQLFGYGFKATAIITLIFIVFTVIFVSLSPELKEKTLEAARIEMEKDSRLDDTQVDDSVKMMEKFFMVGIIGSILLFFLIVGCIGSLIGAAVTKKRPVNPIDQLNM